MLAPPPGTTNPSKQWVAGRGLRDRDARDRKNVARGGTLIPEWGLPCYEEEGLLSQPAGLPAPAHTARLRGRRSEPSVSADRSPGPPPTLPRPGLLGKEDGGLGFGPSAVERCRVLFPDLFSLAWSERLFPGGRSSRDPEAGLSLLGSLYGLQISLRSSQKAWVLSPWDMCPGVRATVSDHCQRLAPRHQLYMTDPDKAERLPGS